MAIGIFQDVHANLPAFKKAIEIFKKNDCKKIYHVGDLIGIGPHPKEVFEEALKIDELILIMGNHDYWFANGIPYLRPKLMSKEEYEHQKWSHIQIGLEKRDIVKQWKFIEELSINEYQKVTFMHYGYDEKEKWFKEFVKKPNREKLDKLFEGIESEFIFYGHNHESSDIIGNSRYVNLGSTGCNTKPEVRIGILEMNTTRTRLEKITEPYDDNGLMEDFEKRKVPARDFIMNNFIVRK